MKILISGSNGMVGSSLARNLDSQKHEIYRLVRTAQPGKRTILWNPLTGHMDRNQLDKFDAVIHLSGESIASGRWTKTKKEKIRDSRVMGTRHLAHIFSTLANPPETFISASAIGFYGDRGEEILDESSPIGSGFLADVCRDWEEASLSLKKKGTRVAQLRFGIILSPRGGALAKMLMPFKMGAGGVLGTGKQYMSWVGLDDAVRAIEFVLNNPKLEGPFNVVSPRPVTNAEFTRILGNVLVRPTFLPMPAFAARLVFGEMADALLLSSSRVMPKRLLESGYSFTFSDLETCLRRSLPR